MVASLPASDSCVFVVTCKQLFGHAHPTMIVESERVLLKYFCAPFHPPKFSFFKMSTPKRDSGEQTVGNEIEYERAKIQISGSFRTGR